MSATDFYFVSNVGNGSVWIGPRPLLQSFRTWPKSLSEIGVTHVVSLISKSEVATFSLQGEGRALNEFDIGFSHFPIDDFDTPDAATFPELINQLTTRLAQGENLFLHCAGGIGRAGTTAACLLVKHGMTAETAMALVSEKRGEKSPETIDQENFVKAFQP